MSEYNPYTPPGSEVSPVESIAIEPICLAERGTRLGASLLDGLIIGIPIIGLIWLFYFIFGETFLEPIPGAKGVLLTLGAMGIGALVDFAANGYLLYKNGQTIGKKICNIKIVKLNGDIPTLFESFIKRRVLFSLIQQIPFLGNLFGLANVLMIFRESRRCLHDYFAGTIVIKS